MASISSFGYLPQSTALTGTSSTTVRRRTILLLLLLAIPLLTEISHFDSQRCRTTVAARLADQQDDFSPLRSQSLQLQLYFSFFLMSILYCLKTEFCFEKQVGIVDVLLVVESLIAEKCWFLQLVCWLEPWHTMLKMEPLHQLPNSLTVRNFNFFFFWGQRVFLFDWVVPLCVLEHNSSKVKLLAFQNLECCFIALTLFTVGSLVVIERCVLWLLKSSISLFLIPHSFLFHTCIHSASAKRERLWQNKNEVSRLYRNTFWSSV